MQTVVETSLFTKQADKLFSADERNEVINYLAANPLAGDVIPGTGGVRKVRIALTGGGKSGGSRVIYFVYSENAPIYALLAYPKSKQTNLTPDEKAAVKKFAVAMKKDHRSKS